MDRCCDQLLTDTGFSQDQHRSVCGCHAAGDAVVEQWMADAEAAGAPAQQMYDRLLELVD
jgi:hypothetical protein